MVNDSAATESLLKHIKPLWIFPALILTACGVEPRLPGPVVREEVGNIQDLAQFDRVPQQVLDLQHVSNFDRLAYNGPLGIDTAMDTSDVVEELRGSRIDFVARYYRDPTSSLPALSSQEARRLDSLGLKIVAVWEQNSPDPENLSYSSGYSKLDGGEGNEGIKSIAALISSSIAIQETEIRDAAASDLEPSSFLLDHAARESRMSATVSPKRHSISPIGTL